MEYKSEELFQVLTFNLASITQIKGVIDHSMLPENLRRVRNIWKFQVDIQQNQKPTLM